MKKEINIDGETYVLKKEKKIKGYFDDVDTWAEAIELLKKADGGHNWGGFFKEIDGKVYFDLCMSNDSSWKFLEKGQKLLTKKDEE